MNGNFKVRCAKAVHSWFTTGKIYEIKDGKITDDDGEFYPLSKRLENIEELRGYASGNEWELVTEAKPSTESISIYCKKNRVVAIITNGEQKFTQSVSMNKAGGDFKIAVKMVVDRLINKFDGFEVKAVEAVVSADNSFIPPLDWSSFKSGKFAVHCDTEEKAREFLKECDRVGLKWCSGRDLTNVDNWECYKNETCYRCDKKGVDYANVDFYKDIEKLLIIDYTPSKPTYQEVHRPANVGEWIKVTNPTGYIDNHYRNGDVKQVVKVDEKYNSGVYFGECGTWDFVEHKEYVVLENYQPPIDSKPEDTEIKVGDTVKVIDRWDNFSTSLDWVNKHARDFIKLYKNENMFTPKNGDTGIVVAKDNERYAIIIGQWLYVMGEKGFVKIK